jgi:hypothetical protein
MVGVVYLHDFHKHLPQDLFYLVRLAACFARTGRFLRL